MSEAVVCETSSAAGQSADGRSFAAARQRANERAARGAAAHNGCRVLERTAPDNNMLARAIGGRAPRHPAAANCGGLDYGSRCGRAVGESIG
jgi:hypothetical protein